MIRLITFNSKSFALAAPNRTGILLNGNKILDLTVAFGHDSAADKIKTMIDIIQHWNDIKSDLESIVSSPPSNAIIEQNSEIRLLAPIPRPKRNVFCIGKNYLDHVQEIASAQSETPPTEKPKYPQIFTKVPEAVIGHLDNIPSHVNITKWLDYEAELAVVIGKKGVDIPKDKAIDYIFGYTIANDVSARDIQKHHVQFFKGKALDGTCPMGPYILPKEYIDASKLSIKLSVNDEERQNSNTSQMIFNIPTIVEQLSRGMTLYPGDIVLTGTPSGVGYAMKPPQMLKNGDVVTIEIEKLGKLINVVADQPNK